MLLALFGIESDALNLVVNLLILSLVLVYFALVAWTYFDARRRVRDPVLVASSVGVSFVFPFIGTIVYSILRPPEFLEDAHEREVEIKAAELRVRQLSEQSCPKCEYPVEKSYLRCPNCRTRLKNPCTSCGKPVDPRWALCPYCEAPVGKPEPARRAERREAPRADREGRPARELRAGREPRRVPAAQRGSGSQRQPAKQGKRAAEKPRRKEGAPGSRRQPASAGSAERSDEREDKQKAETGRPGGSDSGPGEERRRPATAS
ncbi:MAG TPA: zinc ribbon domain-containing protein [Solirubrobacterales bacterium]|nr:zinc ribbon domain-containing protein [Solirubrobacterales bacterium]